MVPTTIQTLMSLGMLKTFLQTWNTSATSVGVAVQVLAMVGPVGEGVWVMVEVGELVGVLVDVLVKIGVKVGVFVIVLVGVEVTVLVAVLVGVLVKVLVTVLVEV